jgi:hypothetical protein
MEFCFSGYTSPEAVVDRSKKIPNVQFIELMQLARLSNVPTKKKSLREWLSEIGSWWHQTAVANPVMTDDMRHNHLPQAPSDLCV